MLRRIILLLLLSFIPFAQAQDIATTKVLVTDFNEQPIRGAEIQFFNTTENITLECIAGIDGRFIIDLPAGVYNIRLKCMGKTKDYTAIEIPKLKENEVYNNINIIIQYEEETSFTLSDLHFETAKSTILTSSYLVLDELVKYMELKPHLKIEIGGHTDSEGGEAENLVLSQARADAVKAYLVKKGIDPKRMIAKGYGESLPIAENETAAGRALNRRTEINIIK